MWTAAKHFINSLKNSAPKNRIKSQQERHYALKGSRLNHNAVDSTTGKALDNAVTKNEGRVVVVESTTGEIIGALTHSPGGPFPNGDLELKPDGRMQRVASTVDLVIVADTSVLSPAPEAQGMITRNVDKIKNHHKEIKEKIANFGVPTRTIIIVNKKDMEQIDNKNETI